jgi:predicted DNA-binding antitoxin AbrB/MazE fold protein
MKKLFSVLSLFTVANAFASGSTEYYCATSKSNLRYDFSEGEEVSAKLYRAIAIDKKKAFDAIVKAGTLRLDGWELANVIIAGAKLNATGCNKEWFENDAEYKKCLEEPNAVDSAQISSQWKSETTDKVKYDRIIQKTEFRDGTKVELNIRNYSSKSYDEEYYGSLTVENNKGDFKDVNKIDVNCTVTSP